MLLTRPRAASLGVVFVILMWLFIRNLPDPQAIEKSTAAAQAGTYDAYASQVTPILRPTQSQSPAASKTDASVPQPVHNEQPVASPDEPQQTPDSSPPAMTDSEIARYIHAIMDPTDTSFPKIDCPKTIGNRYRGLAVDPSSLTTPRYFLALDLHNVVPLMPRLLGTIIETMRFLGPANCALSIVEGRSDDGTWEILKALRSEVEGIGSKFFLDKNDLDPWENGYDHRIEGQAVLRNVALDPLINNRGLFSQDTIIIFINDIAICPEDILELVYQHKYQSATMTCAFDWIHEGEAFYDAWVSRSMVGNIFFEITQDASWDYKGNLFWDDPPSKAKFEKLQPLQVYSCWGGMVTLDAKPFVDKKVTFRHSAEGECHMGEPTLLAKDMWKQGIAKILAVPTVNVGYTTEEGAKIKQNRGYVSTHVDVSKPPEDPQSELIEWQSQPPPMVKCLPNWDQPSWVPPI